MKILFWSDGFLPRKGGIETQGFQLIQCLQERGHQCLVLSQKDQPDWPEDAFYKGIPIKRFDFDRAILRKDLKTFRLIQDYLEWVAKEFQPDIIHLNSFNSGSVFMFSLFNNIFEKPSVLTVHAICKEDIRIFVRNFFSSVDRACCVSKWVLNEVAFLLPEVKSKLRLIYNGLSMPEGDPSPLSFSPPTLLLLGRLSLEKGFATAVEAFALLKRKARLVIAGEGWERPSLEKIISQLGLSDSVQLVGEVEREQALSLINRATLVLVPSHFESFGLVALEAMQMGRAVIATRVGGLQEVVSHGETGLLVPAQDPVALCQAIEELLDDPTRAVQMGNRGRQWAKEHFTLHQNVDQYEAVYRELVQ